MAKRKVQNKNKKSPKKAGAKKTKRTAAPKREASPRSKNRIDRVIEQAKEPLSLIETLKEEGMARAGYLLGIAAEVAGTMTKQNLGAQIAEFGGAVGIVTKADLARLERKLQDISDRLEALEGGTLSTEQDEDIEDGNEDMSLSKQEPYEEESYQVSSEHAGMRTAEEE
jgi:hypothetical protein